MAAASRDTPPTPRLDAESEEDALNWNPDELRLRRALDRQAKVAAGEYVRPRGSIREAIAARRASRGLATERVSISELSPSATAPSRGCGSRSSAAARSRRRRTASTWPTP